MRMVSKSADHSPHLVIEHQIRSKVGTLFVEEVAQALNDTLKVDDHTVYVLLVVFYILV